MYRSYVMICGGPNCTLLAGRQEKLAEEFEVQLKLAGLRKEVQVMRGGCLGLCSSGPNVAVFPEGTIYSHVHVEDVAEIVSEHLLKGRIVTRLLYDETVDKENDTVKSLNETDFYKKQDLHIHIPEGATPKDGPSAGVTMTTAMLSALTGAKVRNDVAMTGEVTIRGRVLAIGGLQEKVLAAKKAGVKTVILPKQNEKDLQEISDEIKEGLEFVLAKDMDDVLKHALAKGESVWK